MITMQNGSENCGTYLTPEVFLNSPHLTQTTLVQTEVVCPPLSCLQTQWENGLVNFVPIFEVVLGEESAETECVLSAFGK